YRAWGEGCVAQLRGDFAFAVWDAPARKLFCARDHFGARLLYHAAAGGSFVFSNTLACVRLHPGVSGALDEAAVGDFLLFGRNLELGSTVFAQVRALPPAHVLVVEGGRVRTARWWSLPVEAEPRAGGARALAEEFVEVLGRAVADRLPRHRAAVLLSGGRDSTAVAALARSAAPEAALRAFTAGYRRRMADPEPRFAELAAGYLGIGWELQGLDEYRPFQGWESGEVYLPEPSDHPLLAATADLYRRALAHAPVALTGDGGDLVLRESESRLARLLLAGRVGRALAEGLAYLRWHRRLPRPGFRTLHGRRSGRLGAAPPLPEWLEPDFARRAGLRDRLAVVEAAPRPPHPLRPEAHCRLSFPGFPRLLEQFDPGVTGVPLQLRHPLLDLRVVEFLLSIPPAQWYNDKGLLRIAMRGRLPPEVVRRPKTPLVADPLLVRLRQDGPGWLGGLALSAAVERFVVPARVPRPAGGSGPPGDEHRLPEDLRPLSLSLWLAA
ncbi:MAG TPA: asparagine synthase-related protein, partial [Longimicrobiaceae bacterium]|nr:asparagine synthase-related protein [Longimicrobiaceae bacterium]